MAFQFKINTALGDGLNTFTLPCSNIGIFNAVIDWGDGGATSTITAFNDAALAHNYAVSGIYTVTVTGTLPIVHFNNTGDKLKLIEVVDLGDVGWLSFNAAFFGCSNMLAFGSATANTALVTSMYAMFTNCSGLTALDVTSFNTALVTNMSYMFRGCSGLFNTLVIHHFVVSSVTKGANFLGATTNVLSQAEYALVLANWSKQSLQPNVIWHFGGAKYSNDSESPLHPKKLVDSVDRYETYPDWPVSTAVTAGDKINLCGYWHTATVSGTTGATAPAINATLGGTFTDGAVTWRNDGQYSGIALLDEPSATNIYPSPEAIVTQTFSVVIGDNTLSMYGTGSIAITAGTATATGYATATEGTDVTINVTVAGTVTCTPTGVVDKAQMEAGSVSTSFTPSIRASETGNYNWPIAGNFDNTQGTMIVDTIVPVSKTQMPPSSLVGLDADLGQFLYHSASGHVQSWDGSNDARNLSNYSSDNTRRIALRWNTAVAKHQIGIQDLSSHGQPWVWGVEAAYDGAFPIGSLINLFSRGTSGLSFRNLPIIHDTDLGVTEIEARYS